MLSNLVFKLKQKLAPLPRSVWLVVELVPKPSYSLMSQWAALIRYTHTYDHASAVEIQWLHILHAIYWGK